MNLIESLTDSDTSTLELDMYQWKSIDKDGHIIAVSITSRLLQLPDHLHVVTRQVLLVKKPNILHVPIIKDEVIDRSLMDLLSFLRGTITGAINELSTEADPFLVCKAYLIKVLDLDTYILQ